MFRLVNLLSTKSVKELFYLGKYLCKATCRRNSAINDQLLAYHCLHRSKFICGTYTVILFLCYTCCRDLIKLNKPT